MTSGEELMRRGVRVWPGLVQRRGAWATAILVSVLGTSMFERWPMLLPLAFWAQPWAQMLAYLLPIPISLLVLPLLGPGSLQEVLRWRASARGIKAGLALGIVLAVVAEGAARLLPSWFPTTYGTTVQVLEPRSWLVFGSLTMVLAAPLTEEWVFRGLLWSSLFRVCGPMTTNLTTAALFTIYHGPDRVRDFPILFSFGFLIAWLRLRTGSVAPGFLAHSIWNLSVVCAPLFW